MERYKNKRIEQLKSFTKPYTYPDQFECIAEQEVVEEQITEENCESVLERLLERDQSAINELSARILAKYGDLPPYVIKSEFEKHITSEVGKAYTDSLEEEGPVYLSGLAEALTIEHRDNIEECPEWDLTFSLVKGKWKCRADKYK